MGNLSRISSRFPLLLLLASFAVPLAILGVFPQWTVDDAFIAYRYGKHLQEFGELNWNPGQPPVEGYTGILLPLLAAAALALKLPLLISIKLLSALATGGTAALMLSILRRFEVRPRIQLVVVVLFLSAPSVYVHQSSGLETSIFTFFMVLAFWGHLRLLLTPPRAADCLLYSASLLLLSLTRPEGVLLSLLSLGLVSAHLYRQQKSRAALLLIAIWLVPAILYMAWRIDHYGHWLPNSFAAKQATGWIQPESIKSLVRFLGQHALLPLLSASLLLLLEYDRRDAHWSHWKTLGRFSWPGVLFMLGCWLVYFRSDLYMNYASRFFFPFFPLLLLLAAVWGEAGWRSLQQKRGEHPQRTRLVGQLLIVAGVLQMGIFAFKWRGELAFVRYYSSIVEDEYRPVAKWLREHLDEDATVICYLDAGAIPYYSGRRAVDMGRLNDAFLARENPDLDAVVDYFFSYGAEAVVMTSEKKDDYIYLEEAEVIRADPRFQQYELIEVFENDVGFPYFQWVYRKAQ
ncbi:MAG: hypothetical protein AAF998_21990 [Bacteroidota bacterium]